MVSEWHNRAVARLRAYEWLIDHAGVRDVLTTTLDAAVEQGIEGSVEVADALAVPLGPPNWNVRPDVVMRTILAAVSEAAMAESVGGDTMVGFVVGTNLQLYIDANDAGAEMQITQAIYHHLHRAGFATHDIGIRIGEIPTACERWTFSWRGRPQVTHVLELSRWLSHYSAFAVIVGDTDTAWVGEVLCSDPPALDGDASGARNPRHLLTIDDADE